MKSDAPCIAVAVSGGADSLYSLIRLREEGARVLALHGLFLPPGPKEAEAAARAMREKLAGICRGLGICLHIVDLREAFLQQVIRPFVQSYAEGGTPNPCALCNARIKFGLLLEAARSLGAHRLATGHYAALHPAPARAGGSGEGERGDAFPALFQGADQGKDQSYFLALVRGRALASALFPLAEISKNDVLAALARQGITPPQPGESQEICFIPGNDYRNVLPAMAKRLGIALPGPGPMLLRDGTRVGTHAGLWQYTEGQRKGLGVGWKEALHVLGKERPGNVLRLGGRQEMGAAGCLCGDLNVLLPQADWPDEVLVKTRYRERPEKARAVFLQNGGQEGGTPVLELRFAGPGSPETPESPAAPGQVAAVYVPWPDATGRIRLRLAAGGVIRAAL